MGDLPSPARNGQESEWDPRLLSEGFAGRAGGVVRRRANRICQTRGRGVSARERTTRNRTFSGLSGYVFTSLGLAAHFSLSISLSLSIPHLLYFALNLPLIYLRSPVPSVTVIAPPWFHRLPLRTSLPLFISPPPSPLRSQYTRRCHRTSVRTCVRTPRGHIDLRSSVSLDRSEKRSRGFYPSSSLSLSTLSSFYSVAESFPL